MILVFTGGAGEGVEDTKYINAIKALFPDTPIVVTRDLVQIKNWLPIVDAVFIHQQTKPWFSVNGLPPHPQVLMVVPENPNVCDVQNVIRNQREAAIKDTFLLSIPEDTERLKERLTNTTIQEKP